MSSPNSLLGTLLHAVGGMSAASCYLPSTKMKGWSWNTFWLAFFFGAIYGFGGMSFGKAINHIGYSLKYTLAIGISAVVGTIMPLMVFGGLGDFFNKPGGGIVLLGMILSILGVVYVYAHFLQLYCWCAYEGMEEC